MIRCKACGGMYACAASTHPEHRCQATLPQLRSGANNNSQPYRAASKPTDDREKERERKSDDRDKARERRSDDREKEPEQDRASGPTSEGQRRQIPKNRTSEVVELLAQDRCWRCARAYVPGGGLCVWCVELEPFLQGEAVAKEALSLAKQQPNESVDGFALCPYIKEFHAREASSRQPKLLLLVPYKADQTAVPKVPSDYACWQLKATGKLDDEIKQARLDEQRGKKDFGFDIVHFYPCAESANVLDENTLASLRAQGFKLVYSGQYQQQLTVLKNWKLTPFGIDRIIWNDPFDFGVAVALLRACLSDDNCTLFLQRLARRRGARLGKNAALQFCYTLDRALGNLLACAESHFLLRASDDVGTVYQTLPFAWRDAARRNEALLVPTSAWPNQFFFSPTAPACSPCKTAQEKFGEASKSWDETALRKNFFGAVTAGPKISADGNTWPTISSRSLPVRLRAFLKTLQEAADTPEPLLFTLDRNIAINRTCHWDDQRWLPWSPVGARTDLAAQIGEAFKIVTEINGNEVKAVFHSSLAHITQRRDGDAPMARQNRSKLAAESSPEEFFSFPATMEFGVELMGVKARVVVTWDAASVKFTPPLKSTKMLVFLSAHYTGEADAQPHYLVFDLDDDPILDGCCAHGIQEATKTQNSLLAFTPTELIALRERRNVEKLFPKNWIAHPLGDVIELSTTKLWKLFSDETGVDFLKIFDGLPTGGIYEVAKPLRDQKEIGDDAPEFHVYIRATGGKEQYYNIHFTFRAECNSTMGVPTAYLFYRLYLDVKNKTLHLGVPFPRLDTEVPYWAFTGSKLLLAICWKWAQKDERYPDLFDGPKLLGEKMKKFSSAELTSLCTNKALRSVVRHPPPSHKDKVLVTVHGEPLEGGHTVGTGLYDAGDVVTIQAEPAPGYELEGWIGETTTAKGGMPKLKSKGAKDPRSSFVVEADTVLVAQFRKTTEVLLKASGQPSTGGQVEPPYAVAPLGSETEILAIPAPGYRFDGWDGSGVKDPSAAATTVAMTQDRSVVAQFRKTFQLAAVADPSDGGKVTGSGTHDDQQTVPVAASPNSGWKFKQWTGDPVAQPLEVHTTITMDRDKKIVARFVPLWQLSVEAQPSEAGTVTKSAVFEDQQEVVLEASAKQGFRFDRWQGKGVVNNRVTMTAHRQVVARFVRRVQLKLVADPPQGGTVSDGGEYDEGQSVKVVATPSSDWEFVSWSGHPVQQSSVTLGQDAVSLIAHFKKKESK